MIGAILAGGLGKRLNPITNNIPKGLIEIKEDYTIIDKQILQFRYSGVNEVYLLVGYLHEKIKERYGNEWNGIKINYIVEDRPIGTAGAIKNLLENVNKRVIIRNGDVVTDANINEMLNSHKENEMIMFAAPLVSPFGIVETSNGKIIDFREKPVLDYLINGGIYIIDPNLFDYFKKYDVGDIEKLLFPKLARKFLINFYKEDCFWYSVDSIKDLEYIRKEYSNRTDKPWGYEKIIALTDQYLTKELYIMKNEGTSFHYHANKDETMHVIKGEIIIDFGNKKEHLQKNDTIRIKPNAKHSIIAVENSLIYEYSTPHIDDTIRVNDKYER